jgi:hypothetical protein
MLRLMVVKRLLAVMAMAPLLAGCGGQDSADQADDRLAAPASPLPSASSATPRTEVVRTGPVEDKLSAASCVEGYTSATLRNRAFAFDGTVLSIGPAGTNKPDKGALPTAAVTFTVNEWFEGGSGETATVDLMSPDRVAGDDTPLYEEGTRMLISGEPRWGGQPLEDAIAWSCGGFTSYYELKLADEWRAALSER